MSTVCTENNWIRKFCLGEEEAYQIFFKEYYQILSVFAMKYVKNKETAEDIVNDVILELYSRKLQFSNLIALKSFLFLSIKNRSLNLLRNHRTQESYLNNPVEEEKFFLNNIIQEEVYYLLHKAIRELPEPVCKIYELSLQELSNEEIAGHLGLTIDSVKAYKKRGKQQLKEKLKGLMPFLSVSL